MGQIVKQLLDEKNISQNDLADKIGVTKQYVSSILKKEFFTLKMIKKISEALNVDPDIFIEKCAICNKEMPKPKNVIDHYKPKEDILPIDYKLKYFEEKEQNERLKNEIIALQKKIIELTTK